MKVFVTGGAGFIGSHLVELLMNEGVDVRVFDSLVSGKRERLSANVDFIQGDIQDTEALAKSMQGMTHVAHLAALVSVAESMTNPLATHEVNVTGTEQVLNAAHAQGVTRVAYASSAAVYGDDLSLPKNEASILRPQSPYALSKALNEMQAGAYERMFGLSTVGLRFFNVYGPGQLGDHPYASVIPRWIEAVRAGRPITIYGDGSQTRDFVHVRDIVQAIYQALMKKEVGVFNIASGKETSLTHLRQIIADNYPDAFEVNYESPRAGDILRSVADISAAHQAFGFEPYVEIAQGVTELLTT